MPMRGELPEVAVRRSVQPQERTGWTVIVAAIADRDLQALVIFSAIGLLATVNTILYFPDFGELLAQLAVFP